MGLKKDFCEFLRTKHIVTHFEKFYFNFSLKMKDLEGRFGAEKKIRNRDFFVLFRIFWGIKWVELTSLLFFFPLRRGG
jgi:hypothetical protein